MPKSIQTLITIFALIIFFFIAAAASYFGLSFSNIFVSSESNSIVQIEKQKPVPPPKTESVITVLLLGYGGAGHDGGTLSDVLMLVRVDYEEKKVSIISIPRDLWIDLPIRSDQKESYKINMAHAIGADDTRYGLKEPQYTGEAGGGEMAKYAVQKVTVIPIDYFMSVSFDGFSKAIDSLGGINVNVPVTFDDYFYPAKGLENETCGFSAEEINEFHEKFSGFELEKQFECRYEHLHFDAGENEMDGVAALKFVRSRHSNQHGGDFARSQRQQAILIAVKDKLLSLDALTNSKEFVDTIGKTIRTDFDPAAVEDLIDLIGNPQKYEIKNINLTTDNVLTNSRSSAGAFILIPKDGIGNWEGIQRFIADNI